MKIGVLALQGAFVEHTRVLKSLGVEAPEIRLPSELATLDGLIIPGGESTTIIKLMMDFGIYYPLKDMASRKFPVFGTCAGAIVLAKSADSLPYPPMGVLNIEVARNAFGRQIDSFETDLAIPAVADHFHGVFIRAPVIRHIAPGVDVLCHLETNNPVAVRQGNLLACTFHPELTDDTRFHQYFLAIARGTRIPHAA